MILNKIKLNDDISIYVGNYTWPHSKIEILKRVEQNVILNPFTYDNTSILIYECPEFNDIKIMGLDGAKKLSDLENWDGAWASKMWVYKQDNAKRKEYYHKHLYTTKLPYCNNDAPIPNDWTFVLYLQIPNDLKNEEGMIFFKYDDINEPYKYRPKEGEFIFFKGDLSHLVKSNVNSKTERISICGNISFNVPKKPINQTLI